MMPNAARPESESAPDEATVRARAIKPHRWKFYRAGGVDQVQLRDGRDLVHLRELDEKLWVAVAMPVKGVHVDPKTLAALDLDGDGRVRLPEIVRAIEWLDGALVDLDVLFERGDDLPLSAIKDVALAAGARRILSNLGKAGTTRISVADLADTTKVFAETRFNGDGVVPADAADDPAVKQAIEDMIAVVGSVPDRSGKPGVDRAKLDAFFAEVRAVAAWQAAADANVRALGDATERAAAALAVVAGKIDDWFVRCRLAAFDARAAAALLGSDADLAALAALDLGTTPDALKRLPLARVEAGRALPLAAGVNPAWAAPLGAFAADCVKPIVGARDALAESDWAAIQAKLAPHREWLAKKPVTAVEKLGLERVAALAASDAETRIGALLVQDLALEAESAQLAAVEKLVLLRRDLVGVLHNFVNFSDFYAHRGAAFQAGTLILDGRSCRLCLEVVDVARHSALAPMAGAYLAYVECRRAGGETMTVAAAFTDGDADHLMVGRNGIFFDRKGRDWDATITKIVSNPISIREAFWAPYKKLARFVEEQVGKRAAAADTESSARMSKTATDIAHADKDAPAPTATATATATAPPRPSPPASAPADAQKEKEKQEEAKSKVDVGTVAAIGVAIGGIGAMFTGILTAFFGLGLWMPLGVIGVLMAISGPSMLLAYLKLRQRNLGPLLDASGWAINGRARINVPFGGALTDVARLPRNAERSLKDPYAEKRSRWRLWLFVLVVLVLAACWYVGRFDRWLPERIRAATVLHRT
jgi:hypothetical protein